MNWTEQNHKLVAEFVFEDFAQAWAFMTEVAMLAERKTTILNGPIHGIK